MNGKVIMIFVFMTININFKLTNASNSSCAVGYGKTYIVTTSGYCANNLALSTEQQCKGAASATGKRYYGTQTDDLARQTNWMKMMNKNCQMLA